MQFSNHVHTYNVNFVESLKVTFALAVWGDTTATTDKHTDTQCSKIVLNVAIQVRKIGISFPLHQNFLES